MVKTLTLEASSTSGFVAAALPGRVEQNLSEFVAVSGYYPKYAIHLLNATEPSAPARRGRVRPALYDDAAKQALIVLWEASDLFRGQRLEPLLRILLPSLERHGHLKLDEVIRFRARSAVRARFSRWLRYPALSAELRHWTSQLCLF